MSEEASLLFGIPIHLLGVLVIAIIPLILSIIKETRYVEKTHLIIGGLISIFYVLIYFDPNFDGKFEDLKNPILYTFLPFGIASFLVGLKVSHNCEDWKTLFFSKRHSSILVITFLIPLLLNKMPPKIIDFPYLPDILDFGLLMLILVNIVTYALWGIKHKKHN